MIHCYSPKLDLSPNTMEIHGVFGVMCRIKYEQQLGHNGAKFTVSHPGQWRAYSVYGKPSKKA